ncbi:MAG TPA: choice-of-anchor Q domain-containing protein [Rudaea sp.]|nr:choice-of-anchor Q domain-containing protein [Rudaea sp.]
MKPLATALLLALGTAGPGSDAHATPASFKSQVRAFLAHEPDLKQLRAQYLHTVFPRIKRHAIAPPTGHATVAVTSCADDAASATTPGTLRYAVATASNGDTIDLSHLTCSSITLSQGALPVTIDNLAVHGPGSTALAIDGGGVDRVFAHTGYGALAIDNLTVRNGKYVSSTVAQGGCITSYGLVSLDHAVVSGCTARSTSTSTGSAAGGGISAYQLSMHSSTLSGNSAQAPATGAAIGGGAFVYNYSYVPRGRPSHKRPVVGPNGVSGVGAIYDSTISGNTSTGGAALGGGLAAKYGVKVQASTIAGNNATGTGAAGGNAPFFASGGGIFTVDDAIVLASTVTGNTASAASSYSFGGGISGAKYGGYLALAYSTFDHNAANIGGGAFAKYGLGLYQSTLSTNSANVGGGVALVRPGPEGGYDYFYNSTIATNRAADYGGGVYLLNAPYLKSVSTLIARNTAPVGADIYGYSQAPVTPTPAAAGPTIAGSNNVIMSAVGVTVPPDTITSDPELGPLGNYGGPTQTELLGPGSPAIGKGINPLGFVNDQRGPGFPRGASVNIGSVQGTAAPVVPLAVPATAPWALGLIAAGLGWLGGRRRRRRAT